MIDSFSEDTAKKRRNMAEDIFKVAKECSAFIKPVDGRLSHELERGTTPETIFPILNRVFSKVGRKNAFDTIKVSKEEYNRLVDLRILCLEHMLALAPYMKQD